MATKAKALRAANLSWEPVRNGKFYGSPACCGAKFCTWKAYLDAEAGASKLAATLGPGWKTEVWENLGWYYAATDQTGLLKVHPGGHNDYLALLNGGGGGAWSAHGKTPKAAVIAVMDKALDGARQIERLIGKVSGKILRIIEASNV